MTRLTKSSHKSTGAGTPSPHESWLLYSAKAHLSELVRRARQNGPQTITVNGREEVVVITVAEYRKLKGERMGNALIEAMQASPLQETDIAPLRQGLPVRDVEL